MKNNWKKLGFLEGIPQDKEEYLSGVLDYVIKLQNTDNIIKKYKEFKGAEVMYLPLIFRIAKEVNITEKDINDLYADIGDNYSAKIEDLKSLHDYADLDYEVIYADVYAIHKILEYKNKLNENKD